MKHLKLIIAALLVAATAQAAPKKGNLELKVQINGLRNQKGRVAVALFSNEDDFPEQERALAGAVARPLKAGSSVTFRGLKPGTYAVAILHDENKNDKMDFNWVGMPLEGYGFSRDAAVVLGPPSFEAAAVRVKAKHSIIKITTRYFSL